MVQSLKRFRSTTRPCAARAEFHALKSVVKLCYLTHELLLSLATVSKPHLGLVQKPQISIPPLSRDIFCSTAHTTRLIFAHTNWLGFSRTFLKSRSSSHTSLSLTSTTLGFDVVATMCKFSIILPSAQAMLTPFFKRTVSSRLPATVRSPSSPGSGLPAIVERSSRK